MGNQEFQAMWDKAVAAGQEAAAARVPEPMVVCQVDPVSNKVLKRYEPVMDGVCGFAWVKVRPGNSAFARWLKASGKVRGAAYGGGVDIWISDYDQSMERKEAHAHAMAKVFQESGIKAYADSRMD